MESVEIVKPLTLVAKVTVLKRHNSHSDPGFANLLVTLPPGQSSLTSLQCQRWSKQCHEQVQSLRYNEYKLTKHHGMRHKRSLILHAYLTSQFQTPMSKKEELSLILRPQFGRMEQCAI